MSDRPTIRPADLRRALLDFLDDLRGEESPAPMTTTTLYDVTTKRVHTRISFTIVRPPDKP